MNLSKRGWPEASLHPPLACSSIKAPADDGSVEVLVDLAVDEDFVFRAGGGWESQGYQMVATANELLMPLGLSITLVSVQRWRSESTLRQLSALLASAERQVETVPGRLLLAVTAQDTTRYDGFAEESGSRVIVRFWPDNQDRNAMLIAHEVGHLLGSKHHAEEKECTEEGCIMNRKGYAHATEWCAHHQRLIRENIALTLASYGP